MKIEPVEIIREMEQQFPKEFMICVQAVQIRKLQEQLSSESDE